MKMGKAEQHMVNSRIRQLFQKYYEFGVIKKHLKRNRLDLRGKTILDAGCGSGYSTALISDEFQPQEIHAFDAMPEQVELAQKRGLPANVCIGDIANTEYPAETFDAVFTFGVFHHVPEWKKAIQEMSRVLKPGGVLVGGEIIKESSTDFEWAGFAEELKSSGLTIVENDPIYMGFFKSFLCQKSDPAEDTAVDTAPETAPSNHTTLRWLLLAGLIFAIILVPFVLFGPQVEAWTERFIDSASERPGLVAAVLGGLLAFDILLPVPSSLVSTAAGFLLGMIEGLVVSLAGMTISCVLGYWLGRRFGHPVARRIVGESELVRLKRLSHRLGDWAIVVSRPVPMLAEASVLFAGIGNMPPWRFLLLSTLSNLGIAVVYAAVGALSASVNSFLLAFGGSILIPLVVMIAAKKDRRPAG